MSQPPKQFEFDTPYSLTSSDGMKSRVYWLRHDGHSIASFSVDNFGGEQECIESAWNLAYRSDDTCEHCGSSTAPQVKPLVWVDLGDKWNTVTSGRIQITQRGCRPNWDLSCASADADGYFDTLDEAKASAQADYERRILGALE